MEIYISTKSEYSNDEYSVSLDNKDEFTKVSLSNADVKAAKKCIYSFINTIKAKSEEKAYPSFYYTSLLMMNLLSQEILKGCSPEYLKTILKPTRKKNEEEK